MDRFKEAGDIAVFAVRKEGVRIAGKISGRVEVYPPETLKGGGLKRKAAGAWRNSRALVFVGAAGIAVRTIAPFIRNKAVDPAVIVIDDAGRFVISLLSGHLGGANRLAMEIARSINATPVVTTATDSMGLAGVEEMALDFGLKIEDAKKIKKINSAILDNKKVIVVDRSAARLASIKKAYGRLGNFRFQRRFPPDGSGAVFVAVTPFIGGVPEGLRARTLILRPGEFVAGIGCARGADDGEIERALAHALRKNDIAAASIKKIASINIKIDESGLLRFAGKRGIEVAFFSPAELGRRTKRRSRMVLKHTGAGAVCEPAALLGAKALRLWSRKITVGRVTVALAREPFTPLE